MKEYFFRVQHTATNEQGEILKIDKKDFKEEDFVDFFHAKNEALTYAKSFDGLKVMLNKTPAQKLKNSRIKQDIYIIEVLSDGREKAHQFRGASDDIADQKIVEFEQKIYRQKRKEICSKNYSLEDFQKVASSKRWYLEPLLSYHIVKVELIRLPVKKLIETSLTMFRDRDCTFSRRQALNEYKNLVKDPTIRYSDRGMAYGKEEEINPYILELNLRYGKEKEEHTLYSTITSKEDERMSRRIREKKLFDYYGFEYPTNVRKRVSWDD